MPFVSRSQRAYFYANPRMHKYIDDFNAATQYKVGQPRSNLERLTHALAKRTTERNR